MNRDLLFDFDVNKETKTVTVTREFDAEQSLVWDAFTKQEILDQWWAPKPYTIKTKYMNFEVGGKRFYAMVSPDGAEHWSLQEYTSITPITNFKMRNAFADKDGKPEQHGSEWDHTFSEANGVTKVRIVIYNESYERMENILDGFRAGFTATLNYLDSLLKDLSKPRK